MMTFNCTNQKCYRWHCSRPWLITSRTIQRNYKNSSQILRKHDPSSFSLSKQPRLDSFLPKNNAATQKLLDEAIVKFLSDSGVAFRVVDLDSYKEMLKITNDKVQVKSRSYHSKFVTMKA